MALELKTMSDTKICLCMLTKNSSKYIVRTLDSIIGHQKLGHRIGFCLILVDDSTTDNCEDIMRSYLSEHKVTYKMKRAKWMNYSYNRNLALDLCDTPDNPCEYTWMNDDDDYLVGDPFIPSKLDKDVYNLRLGNGNITWWRPQIINRSNRTIRYKRRVHEYMENAHFNSANVEGNYYLHAVASPMTPEKVKRYIQFLEEDLKDMP